MEKSAQKAILLTNIGTPHAPDLPSVRSYLRRFLFDPLVIQVPTIFRFLLVYCIIVPFKAKGSLKKYKKLWTPNGFPLAFYTKRVQEGLQQRLSDDAKVYTAMRYSSPDIAETVRDIAKDGATHLTILPLFPQYAISTTQTSINEIEKQLKQQDVSIKHNIISQFYDNQLFIELWADKLLSYKPVEYDAVLFSFHGLPISHIKSGHPSVSPAKCKCIKALPKHGKKCYRATCYETARLIAKSASLESYGVAFQSRLSKNWIQPFADQWLVQKAKEGAKNILVISPSFVSDCLETTIEIEEEYQLLFQQHGGKKLTLIEGLNDDERWYDVLEKIVRTSI